MNHLHENDWSVGIISKRLGYDDTGMGTLMSQNRSMQQFVGWKTLERSILNTLSGLIFAMFANFREILSTRNF